MRYRTILSAILILAVFSAYVSAPVLHAQARPQADWLPTETDLSGWLPEIYDHRLVVGPDGTLAAFWVFRDTSSSQWSLWGRVRRPGSGWSQAMNLSGYHPYIATSMSPPTSWDVNILPDGMVWAIWAVPDSAHTHAYVRAAYYSSRGPWQNDDPTIQPMHCHPDLHCVKLAANLDGDLIAAWKGMSGALHVARRFPETPGWEPVDDIGDGEEIDYFFPLVGIGGQIVVVWEEENPANTSENGVLVRSLDTATGIWSPPKGTPPLSGWKTNLYLSQPVIGPDNTVVTAWKSNTANPVQEAVFSSTRDPASGTWSAPDQISSSRDHIWPAPKLVYGQNGTTAAVWILNSPSQAEVFANMREPGGDWGTETSLSGIQDFIDSRTLNVGIWPDGSALAVWRVTDQSSPTYRDRISWSSRPPEGTWGDGGQGYVSAWEDHINSLDFALGHDGSAVLVWGVKEATGLYSAQTATWPPGGPWDSPVPISGNYSYVEVGPDGLAMGLEGRPVAVAWTGESMISSDNALLFNEQIFAEDHQIYLPLVKR